MGVKRCRKVFTLLLCYTFIIYMHIYHHGCKDKQNLLFSQIFPQLIHHIIFPPRRAHACLHHLFLQKLSFHVPKAKRMESVFLAFAVRSLSFCNDVFSLLQIRPFDFEKSPLHFCKFNDEKKKSRCLLVAPGLVSIYMIALLPSQQRCNAKHLLNSGQHIMGSQFSYR